VNCERQRENTRIKMDDGTMLTTRPAGTGLFSAVSGKGFQNGMGEEEMPGELGKTSAISIVKSTQPSFEMAAMAKLS
jgi:hypothetical protein